MKKRSDHLKASKRFPQAFRSERQFQFTQAVRAMLTRRMLVIALQNAPTNHHGLDLASTLENVEDTGIGQNAADRIFHL